MTGRGRPDDAPAMADPSDGELLEAWRGGEPRPGEELFRRHFACVHRYFANKVGNERDVEDLIQRTFLACVEGRDRFAGAAKFKTWLLGIAHNILCEHYRRGRRRGDAVDFSIASVRDLCDGPSTLLRHVRDQQALLEGLRAIPLEMQVVLELYYWEHFTGPELGEFLGVGENTARSRLRRAKELLIAAIAELAPGPRAPQGDEDLDAWAARVRASAFDDPT